MRNFNYWCFVLAALFFIGCHRDSPKTIDIYSVAVGFQKESITQSGIAVSRFFYGLAPGTNEYNGVLFQIVAPEQFAGQYFWMLHDGYLASGDASLLYKPESVYKFPMAIGVARKDFHDIEYIRKLVCERDLFCLHPKGYYLNTLRPVGERIFASESEVSSEISRLQKIIDDIKSDMNESAYLKESSQLRRTRAQGEKDKFERLLEFFFEQDRQRIEKIEASIRELREMSQSGELSRQVEIIKGIVDTKKAEN